jgi:lytic murein transglycosylase
MASGSCHPHPQNRDVETTGALMFAYRRLAVVAALVFGMGGAGAAATPCGNDASGFDGWKAGFREEAAAAGVADGGLTALDGTRYASRTIAADRGQRSFQLSLDEFTQRRGADAIVAEGRRLKAQHAALFERIESRFGVPPGPLIAIWGMESAFGRFMGDQHVVSAVATLAYDCRRPDFFRPHLHAALILIDLGWLDAGAIGAAHGEIGQTQFLPGNVLRYAIDGDGDGRIDLIGSKADALASTANFLQAQGWTPGLGYQPGELNFAAIEAWNAARVYQEAIAIMGRRIDAP